MVGTPPQDSITGTQYSAFEQAYQRLSTTVFVDVLGHALPPCLITLQRRHFTYGYFCRDRYRLTSPFAAGFDFTHPQRP